MRMDNYCVYYLHHQQLQWSGDNNTIALCTIKVGPELTNVYNIHICVFVWIHLYPNLTNKKYMYMYIVYIIYM